MKKSTKLSKECPPVTDEKISGRLIIEAAIARSKARNSGSAPKEKSSDVFKKGQNSAAKNPKKSGKEKAGTAVKKSGTAVKKSGKAKAEKEKKSPQEKDDIQIFKDMPDKITNIFDLNTMCSDDKITKKHTEILQYFLNSTEPDSQRSAMQIEMVKKALSNIASSNISIIELPNGGGKTIISLIVGIILSKLNPKLKITVLVPTNFLVTYFNLFAKYNGNFEIIVANKKNVLKSLNFQKDVNPNDQTEHLFIIDEVFYNLSRNITGICFRTLVQRNQHTKTKVLALTNPQDLSAVRARYDYEMESFKNTEIIDAYKKITDASIKPSDDNFMQTDAFSGEFESRIITTTTTGNKSNGINLPKVLGYIEKNKALVTLVMVPNRKTMKLVSNVLKEIHTTSMNLIYDPLKADQNGAEYKSRFAYNVFIGIERSEKTQERLVIFYLAGQIKLGSHLKFSMVVILEGVLKKIGMPKENDEKKFDIALYNADKLTCVNRITGLDIENRCLAVVINKNKAGELNNGILGKYFENAKVVELP